MVHSQKFMDGLIIHSFKNSFQICLKKKKDATVIGNEAKKSNY